MKGDNGLLMKFEPQTSGILVILTVAISILFWSMDFRWRKHLRMAAERERIISLFINSTDFDKWLNDESSHKNIFPLYDPIGWIYSEDPKDEEGLFAKLKKILPWWRTDFVRTEVVPDFDDRYRTDPDMFTFGDIAFYKDAKFFYGIMIFLSIALGLFMILCGDYVAP